MGTRVYVGNLPLDCRERDLEKFFSGYGMINDILMKNGYAFVEMDDFKDAEDAVFELNGRSLLDSRVKLEIARGPSRRSYNRGGFDRFAPRKRNNWIDKYGPPTRTKYRLIVENLSSRVSWQDLKDYMRQAGEVTYADAHKQRKNEGVVEFATYADLKSAMKKLNDTDLNGRIIKLIEDGPQGSGRRSSSRSYSRSRSRSRSRSPKRRHGSGSRSRSRSKSRSRSRSRSRSLRRSPSPAKDRSRSRSCSEPKDLKYEAGSRSPSKSPKRDMDDEE